MISSSPLRQEIRFVVSRDGTRIATSTTGTGHTIVRAAHWLTHVTHDLESPVWKHWVEELSSQNRLIRYDLRGCGLSDRDVSDISFDAWLADLEAVTESLTEPFTLVGMSQGGALSIAFALKHPERVERLVLIGAYAKGSRVRAKNARDILEAETLANLMRLGWGSGLNAFNQVFTDLFIPKGNTEQQSWWQTLEKQTACAETAAQIFEVLQRIDVSGLLEKVTVPTLIFHARNDARIPFAEGQRLASSIPDAQFVPLESSNHVMLEDEPAWDAFRLALRSFLPHTSTPPFSQSANNLTPAERAVLDLVAKGLGNREIAYSLNKSEKTVRNQVSTLFEKLGVHTRAELIVHVLSGPKG